MADFYANIEVYKPGYEWSSGADPARPQVGADPSLAVLHCHDYAKFGVEAFRSYDPFLEEPMLFRTFAELEPYPWPGRAPTVQEIARFRDGILHFCNQYGDFNESTPVISTVAKAVRLMRAAVELGDAICAEDMVVLDKYLYFYEIKTQAFDTNGNYIMDNERSFAEELESHGWKFRSCFGLPFHEWVVRLFGKKSNFRGWALRHTPIAEVTGGVPGHWFHEPCKRSDLLARATDLFGLVIQSQTDVGAVIRCERSPAGQLTIRVHITNLLTVLWVQLAVSIIERRGYRRCKMCNKPFEVGPRTNRRAVPIDKKFCTVTCRVNSLHRRQVLAREMQSQGAKLRDIVKAVESDAKTVKKWLGEK